MKRKLIGLLMLGVLILAGSCSLKKEGKGSLSDDNKRYTYYVSTEEGTKKDGTVLYRIEYEYDANGDEKRRTAYNSNGEESKELLRYAYDQQEVLEEYWTVVPDEEMTTGYWRTYKDYDFVYDTRGNLTTWNIYDDNEAGLAKVTFTYEAVVVPETRKEEKKNEVSENDQEENDLKKEIEMRGGLLVINGEEYHAIYGEQGALVYRKVNATFDMEEHYQIAFASSERLSEGMKLLDVEKKIYCTRWMRWSELTSHDFSITSIGEDMFEVCTSTWGTDSLVFINGKENKFFSLNSMGVPQIYRGDEKQKLADVDRLNRFDEGKMLVEARYRYYKSGYDVPDEKNTCG